jgi:hypothetical protein
MTFELLKVIRPWPDQPGSFLGSYAYDAASVARHLTLLSPPSLPSTLIHTPHQTTGIIATIMIIASCLCCCSFAALCSTGCPKVMRICGCIGFIITVAAVSLYTGWVALGTYFVIKIHGAEAVCRNTIMYLVLLYVYLVVLTVASSVMLVWKCNDWRKEAGTHSGIRRKSRTSKKSGD